MNYESHPLKYAQNLYLNVELVTDLIIHDTVTKINMPSVIAIVLSA